MRSHARGRRRTHKSSGQRARMFSDVNHGLRPQHTSKTFTAAGLEQARLEAAAQAEVTRTDAREPKEVGHA